MTMTSTYDHRIIQGAESGSFLRRIDQLLQGEDGFYESVAEQLEIPTNLVTNAHPASASAPPLSAGGGRHAEHRGRRRARPRAAAGGTGGDLSAQGLPHPRPSGGERQPARGRAEGRPGARARERQPDPGAHVADPGVDPADRGRRRDVARRAAADARRLLLDDRVPDRAPLLASAADVVARDDRDRLAPGTARGGREAVAALAPARGVPVRALPAEGLPGPEDVLDRGPRRDRADARRDRHSGAPERGRGGRDRDGSPRPAQRPRSQPRPLGRIDPGRVRGRQGARPGEGDHRDAALGHRRRQVPPRRRGPVHDPRRRAGQGPPLPESEPPRVRRSGGHRRRPRRADRALGPEASPQPPRRRPGAAARRRSLPRPGCGRRDAQPAVARRLFDRRHDPPDHRQPGRLHHRPDGGPLDPVRRRHGEGLQLPDHPRQRR